ncbi:MAG: hypothetical protein DHS20C13_26050 [Thermodesulfobacteriota bacterium]|nr:MAG: hypothetical protein DHS20C13_26050 [Thermodesulfobacteriota bacterium]
MSSDTKEIDRILDFWFGSLIENEIPSEEYQRKWWIKNHENDMQIKNQFGDSFELANKGGLNHWKANSDGTLALIILLDQFSRNIFRDTAEAFSQDQEAINICINGIKKGFDNERHPIQRIFYYMPLMHSEDMGMQEKSIECFSNLAKQFTTPETISKMVSGSSDYALKHYVIIKRFKRYPHRNKILGRESTQEEIEFLSQPGSSF